MRYKRVMMLKTSHFRPFVAALSAGAIVLSAVSSAGAAAYVVAGADDAPLPADYAATEDEMIVAQADCYSVGQQVAAERGGDLLDARSANRNGREVCIIAVLVPGRDGKPAKRVQVVVPAG